MPGEIKIEIDDEGNEEEVEGDDLMIFDLLNENINANKNYIYMTLFEKYVERLTSTKKMYNTKNEETSVISEIASSVIMDIITKFDEINFDNLDSIINYLLFFRNLIRLFPVNVDIMPLEKIISNIESYLKDKNYVEQLSSSLLCLLEVFLSINKQATLKYYEGRINNIYEGIKKIILNEKVKKKLDELKNIKKKMLPSEKIKDFFNYINNKTKGENLFEQTFLTYKNFIIGFGDNSSLSKIIKQLLEDIEDYKAKKDISNKGKIIHLMGLVKNDKLFYVNSILQQLNNISLFRDAIISLDIDLKLRHNEMIKELQKMFIYMKYSENKVYNSTIFCFCFIEEILKKEKREGLTFIDLLFKKLEESLINTKYKYILEDTFQITECISTKCLECGYIEDKFDKCKILTLDIKGYKNLEDALKHRFSENKINSLCKKCKRNTKKRRKSSISKLPNVIIFHLDRIHDNYEYGKRLVEKIDDRFEFNMQNIDFQEPSKYKNLCTENDTDFGVRENSNKIYKRENEYYKYNMKGIINYSGNAEMGEYCSLIKLSNKKWIQIVDEEYSEMDEETVKVLSYGNNNGFGLPSAYFLIYERQKEYPIRILDNKKTKKKSEILNQNYISFNRYAKDEINEKYDISKVQDDEEVMVDIKKLVFHDENLDETFSKVSSKDIDIQVPKNYFIMTIEENNKYFRYNDLLHYENCELILLDAIDSNYFFIFDNKDFDFNDIKKLIYFFNKIIFEDKLNKIDNLNLLINEKQDEEFKKYINIFINKLLIPILEKENKTNEIYELILIIAKIFLSEGNIKLILEFDENKRIFDDETVKKFLNIIYKIISNLIDKEGYNKNLDFKHFFNKLVNSIKEYNNDNLYENDYAHDYNLLNLYQNIKKLIMLNKDIFTLEINILLNKLKKVKYQELRKIIYEIISIIIKNNKDGFQLKEAYKILDYKLSKKIFKENQELLSELLIRINYKDFREKNNFNDIIIPSLFNYALKSNQIKSLMDLLYKIINIKDEFTLERLYLIMGFPQMIIEKQKKFNEEEENKENTTLTEHENYWPKFGIPFIKNYSNEIYKYISNIKIYESHCILAQLFPCSFPNYYDNNEFLSGDKNLDENDVNLYIYKLLNIALLNEGNYCLFKYIYLTQSRFILKYNNLYVEMIDILSKDKNKYDLNEIKKNAEICIKRINYEIGNTKKEEFNTIPELPESMRNKYKEYNNIKEFKGFIPKYLPNEISKVIYSVVQAGTDYMIIFINYFTTFKSLETFREEYNEKYMGDTDIKKKNNDDIKDNRKDTTFCYFEIGDYEIGYNEKSFLLKFYDIYQKYKGKYKNFLIEDQIDDSKIVKSSLIRCIYYNKKNNEILLEDLSSSDLNNNNESNYFFTKLRNIVGVKIKDYCEIFNIYRRNIELDFVKESEINHELTILNKNKLTYSTERYFHDENK